MTKNLWHELSPGPNPPESFYTVVEVPKGSRNKYEYSKTEGVIMLDRVLYSPVYYPTDYGFIPQSYYGDGDPMDVLVMMNEPTFPGCVIEVRPVAMLKLIDKGDSDDKVLAVPVNDPYFSNVHDIGDVPPHFIKEIEHFFMVYKQLENKKMESHGWVGAAEAKEAIRFSLNHYDENIRGK